MSNKIPTEFQFGDAVWVIRKNYVDTQQDPFDIEDPIVVIMEDGSSVSTDEPDLVALVHPWTDGEDD
jgi:hypothetical protein